MTEKVKLTREQADTVDSLLGNLKGMRFTELLKALQYGYEVKPEYKVGDWVTVTANNTRKGETFEIIEKRDIGIYLLRMNNTNTMLWHVEEFRHATPEEIKAEKERRLWVGIGRRVGEFRIGDVHVLENGNSVYITDVDYARAKYIQGTLKGFYPIVSFISFEEDDSNA